MPQFSIRTDFKQVQLGIRNVGAALPGLTKDAIRRIMLQAKKQASGGYSGGSSYAVPPPPGSGYERTGEYGRSFDVVEEGLTFRLETDARNKYGRPYSKYVGGTADGSGQAGIHQGRWPLIIQVMRDWVRALLVDLNEGIRQAISREGLGL